VRPSNVRPSSLSLIVLRIVTKKPPRNTSENGWSLVIFAIKSFWPPRYTPFVSPLIYSHHLPFHSTAAVSRPSTPTSNKQRIIPVVTSSLSNSVSSIVSESCERTMSTSSICTGGTLTSPLRKSWMVFIISSFQVKSCTWCVLLVQEQVYLFIPHRYLQRASRILQHGSSRKPTNTQRWQERLLLLSTKANGVFWIVPLSGISSQWLVLTVCSPHIPSAPFPTDTYTHGVHVTRHGPRSFQRSRRRSTPY